MFRAVAVVTLTVGVPEEDVVGKQHCACCNRDVGVLEKEVVGKQVGEGCNRAYLVSEEDVDRKQDDSVRIRIRR